MSNSFIMTESIVRPAKMPYGRLKDNGFVGIEGEHAARALVVETKDDLSAFASINLIIDDLDCGAMTKTTSGNTTTLSMTLTSSMIGRSGRKICQLIMVNSGNTVVQKSSQFEAYVGRANEIERSVDDGVTIIILSEAVTEMAQEAAAAAAQEAVADVVADCQAIADDASASADAAAQSASDAQTAAASIVVDSALDATSTHALQNKVVTSEINALKADLGDLDGVINGQSIINYIDGKNIDASGALVDATDFCVSDFVPITWTGYGTYYCNDNTVQYKYIIAFYDANKTYIQQFKNPSSAGGAEYRAVNHETQVTQGTPAFVRFSFKSGTVGKIMNSNRTADYWVAESTSSGGIVTDIGDLSELVTEEKGSLVGAINEVVGSIPSLSDKITPKDTTFFVSGINLVDPDTCITGQFVNQTTGAFADNSNHKRTDYVPVEPNTSYLVVESDNAARDTRYAFYKSDKTFISGGLITTSQGLQVITSPENAAYMVASVGTTAYEIMVAQTDTVIPFEPYALYIDKQYINLGSEIIMNVPAKIYAVVGYELNIYFENIVEDWTKYDWNVDCTVGKQMERGYTITPEESDVGTKTLTIKATDEQGNVKTVISSLIITSASAGSGSSKSVVILGDSTTNNGIVIEKLNANFAEDVMNLSTLGTRGTAPNLHEGRSGWKLSDYFTKEYIDYTDGRGHVENPFYNPTSQTFDASYYFANSGVSVPDFFVVNMGINDAFNPANDTILATTIEQFVGYVDSIITSLRTVSQTVKICICCTIPPNHSQDAFGKAYGCNQTRNRCKRNNTLLVDRIIEEYDGRESEGIYLIPIHTNLDTVYNMGMETLSVNARNTAITYQSPIKNGGVHPVESGYWQIADVYTAFLKANA